MLILQWLLGLLLRGKALVSLGLITAFCLWLSAFDREHATRFRFAAVSTFLLPVQTVVASVRLRADLQHEAAAVRKENAELSLENVRLRDALAENERLRDLLGMRPLLPYPVVTAPIISRETVRLGGNWVVAAGAESGVEEGMAAVGSRGLVGRILSSASGHSQMQVLADQDCKVSVISSRSRNPGMLLSIDGTRLMVEFSTNADLRVGDSLVTWGAGGIFPKGIPVGKIASMDKFQTGVLRRALVQPFQDPLTIEEVFLVVRPALMRIGADMIPPSPEYLARLDSARYRRDSLAPASAGVR